MEAKATNISFRPIFDYYDKHNSDIPIMCGKTTNSISRKTTPVSNYTCFPLAPTTETSRRYNIIILLFAVKERTLLLVSVSLS